MNRSSWVEKKAIYTDEELQRLDRSAVPHHVAIIPDGNRRWAKKRDVLPQEGHRQGTQTVIDVLNAASQLGVKVLTLYTFSTENWARPREEVEFLMELLEANLRESLGDLVSNGIRLNVIGDIESLPPRLKEELQKAIRKTSYGQGIQLLLALNYGSRNEMLRAVQRVVRDIKSGALNEADLDVVKLAGYLDTATWGDPELLIRTSGERRISNFLLWQISYTELYFTDKLWPDFTPRDLLEAILEYQLRVKRLGT